MLYAKIYISFSFLSPQLLQVLTEIGDVSIMGVDGSFEIDVGKGNIKLQVNKLNSSSSKQLSTATTLDGNIHTTVDPEVKLNLHSDLHIRKEYFVFLQLSTPLN